MSCQKIRKFPHCGQETSILIPWGNDHFLNVNVAIDATRGQFRGKPNFAQGGNWKSALIKLNPQQNYWALS